MPIETGAGSPVNDRPEGKGLMVTVLVVVMMMLVLMLMKHNPHRRILV